MPFSNYVIARHAFVPWQSPERVPFVCNYLLLWLNYRLRIYSRLQRHCLCNTPTAPLPRPPAPHGQGNVLSAFAYIITDIVRKFAYFSNRDYVKLRSLSAKNYAKLRTFYFSNYVKLRSFVDKSENNVYNWT